MKKSDFKLNYKAGDVFNYFVCSDTHIGNDTFDHEYFTKDFEMAKKNNCKIFIFGDVLDMIVPNDIVRYNVGADPYHSPAYVNDIINNAVKVLEPYVDYLALLSHGNHETVFQKRHSCDPLELLVYLLNEKRDKKLPPIIMGDYIGFIGFNYEHKSGGHTKNQLWYYDHGKGGAAVKTKGTLDIDKMMQRAWADVYLSGHKHVKLVLPAESIFDIDARGNIYDRKRTGIITGSYLKNVKGNGSHYQPDYGYEKMTSNQSTGGVMLTHTVNYDKLETSIHVDV